MLLSELAFDMVEILVVHEMPGDGLVDHSVAAGW